MNGPCVLKICLVESSSDPDILYSVDLKSGFCSCSKGSNYGPCSHKSAINKFFHVSEFSCLPYNDSLLQACYHYIAHGGILDPEWYRDHTQPDIVPDVNTYVEAHKTQGNIEHEPVIHELDDDINTVTHMDVSQTSNVSQGENVDTLIAKYKNNYKSFEANLFSNLHDKDFIKAFKKYSKILKRLSKAKCGTLKSKLYTVQL